MRRSTASGTGGRALAIGGGLLGIAALAGCAPAASGPATSTEPAASASTATAAATGDLRDGTYRATGDYSSPGGPSSIAVSVTLKDGTISAVTVEPKADNPTARQYESRFASGIGAVAVGKPIEGLDVGVVSGSSLTGRGFEKALAAIRADAAA